MILWLAEFKLGRYRARRDAEIRKARNLKKTADEIDGIVRDWEYDIRSTEEEIDFSKSSRLIRKANKCDIPHPDREPLHNYWETGHYSQRRFLSVAGRALLRADIRREQRERRERWGWLIPVVFGLIGAITGLVSVLNRP